MNTINVENLLEVIRAKIIFFDVLDTSLIGYLEKVFDKFIELGIFGVGNGREEKDKIFVSEVLEEFSGSGSDLGLFPDAVFNVYLIICELAVKVEVFWQCEGFANV